MIYIRLETGLFCILFLVLSSVAAVADGLIHHDLKVTLAPEKRTIHVSDTVSLPEGSGRNPEFALHGGMNPKSLTPGVVVSRKGEQYGDLPVEVFRVKLPEGVRSFTLEYGGAIYHPLGEYGKEYARGFRDTSGIISEEGVFLSGQSLWYPAFDTNAMLSFSLEVNLPSGWDAVSQGERKLHGRTGDTMTVDWSEPEPQQEIYLVASKFTGYTLPVEKISAMVYLRTPDRSLADKYLEATGRYIAMYDKLIGPYPYRKFALLENFWETGFGMPSFTLLGPTVIRLPFIINSSYPHEILHNWWGNSVYPDFSTGNWSEGITAYLADHLLKEQQGQGAEYRQTTLQKYTDFVLGGRDFPLTEFRSRHSSASEAIGYGKCLMFFHMLRLELGDGVFTDCLREFYRDWKFRVASFEDLRKSFEKVSGRDLRFKFSQWVDRTGAPKLEINDVHSGLKEGGFVLNMRIEQTQVGKAYKLRIPVAVTMEGREKAFQTVVEMESKSGQIGIRVPGRPVRLDVDPEFDVFRRLDRNEIPPALSQAFGSKKMLIILPSSANDVLLNGYRQFAEALAKSGPDEVEIRTDKEVEVLPSDRAAAVLGWENRFRDKVFGLLSGYEFDVNEAGARIGKTEIPRQGHSIVLAGRNAENSTMAVVFIASDIVKALPGLGRKLPHYQKYSYLVFEGDEPANTLKGRWPVINSPLTAFIPNGKKISSVKMGTLAARKPLIALPGTFSGERMMRGAGMKVQSGAATKAGGGGPL